MQKTLLIALAFLLFCLSDPLYAQFKKGPYIQDLTSNSARILWETAKPERGRVVYGLKGSTDRSIEEQSDSTFHNILITGLLADSEYEYKVEGDTEAGLFRTFPITIKPIKFIVYGDNRTNMADHQSVVDAIIKEAPLFIINTGDLVESGLSADNWQKFFEIERGLIRNTCIFPTIGNHEIIDPTLSLYKKYFSPPQQNSQKKEWYSFDVANIHIAVFNTYDGLFAFSNEQLKWIEADLYKASQNPQIDHIFTVMHHGPYSASKHGDNTAAKNKVVPILKKYGVDITLAGHDHNYERGEAEGLRYMVVGGGGAPLYSSGQSKYTIYSEKTLHYVVFNIYGVDVSGCAYRIDGSAMDCFNWTKEKDLPDAGHEDTAPQDINQDVFHNDIFYSDLGDIEIYYDSNNFIDVYDIDSKEIIEDTTSDYVIRDESIYDLIETKDTIIYDSTTIQDYLITKPESLLENQSSSSGCNCVFVE